MTKTVTIYKEMHAKVKKFCEQSGYKMTHIISLAIAEYLDRENKQDPITKKKKEK